MSTHIGVIGIIIQDRAKAAPKVNRILTDFGSLIIARTGLPYKERGLSVISLIVEASTDQIGALTGKLGMLEAVKVKSLVVKPCV
ncbi:TM1266 family iron-only hydrogenase system putative regulator [Desulfovibrio ferrophilus]|uniref:Transcriptional regulator n=1 Tax=Desulfovibrio ferrophilus TaxID=241368 RepID=A0A2Z6AXH9_9BACT|nr:TM1266 family iron-only hydrogenase system putative regulator [Desulfovibrio ferrophilus]BBD07941.1 transcriptional regulator [Desulfovibrio ferrophilus]